jgi:hypothetical protein
MVIFVECDIVATLGSIQVGQASIEIGSHRRDADATTCLNFAATNPRDPAQETAKIA